MKMPAPKPLTFGDNRPAPPAMPKPKAKLSPFNKPRRVLKPDARPVPEIERYRQTGGSKYLARMQYGNVVISTVGDDEADAVDRCEQFYMTETKQGQEDSKVQP